MSPRILLATIALAALLAGAAAAATPPLVPSGDGATIVAIVNGDIISQQDVDNRRRLFALSTGLPLSADVLARLTPQITHQLIDERLRLQEAQRRRIVVSDQDIAHAIAEVEARNNMAAGMLRQRLAHDGVAYRTLVDQIRVQLGWTRVLRQQLGAATQIADTDVAVQEKVLKQETGQMEFRVGEIFVPVESPAATEEARRFADAVIEQLRAGAPFAVVAAQFSQSQTALTGGDLGWVQAPELDPAVLRVLNEMPPGAVSNPIAVPGGFDIVTLRAKREIGNDPATMLTLRQAFVPFTSHLDPANPTDQQKQALAQSEHLSATVQSCDALEAANKTLGEARPGNPGEVRLDGISPALRAVLEKLPDNKASSPLVSEDGILVIMVCSRAQKNLGIPSRQDMANTLLNDRIELASRLLMRDLERRAQIDQRS